MIFNITDKVRIRIVYTSKCIIKISLQLFAYLVFQRNTLSFKSYFVSIYE